MDLERDHEPGRLRGVGQRPMLARNAASLSSTWAWPPIAVLTTGSPYRAATPRRRGRARAPRARSSDRCRERLEAVAVELARTSAGSPWTSTCSSRQPGRPRARPRGSASASPASPARPNTGGRSSCGRPARSWGRQPNHRRQERVRACVAGPPAAAPERRARARRSSGRSGAQPRVLEHLAQRARGRRRARPRRGRSGAGAARGPRRRRPARAPRAPGPRAGARTGAGSSRPACGGPWT